MLIQPQSYYLSNDEYEYYVYKTTHHDFKNHLLLQILHTIFLHIHTEIQAITQLMKYNENILPNILTTI